MLCVQDQPKNAKDVAVALASCGDAVEQDLERAGFIDPLLDSRALLARRSLRSARLREVTRH